MTFGHYDLRRSLLAAGALLLACSPVPSEVETADGTVGPGTGDDITAGPGPGTADDSSTSGDATDGDTDDTGPSFDPVCGDGIVETPEECDLGDLNGSGMYCTNQCTSNVCGDGYVGPGEACDDGNDNDDDLCTNLCGVATCGDGAVQAGEDCDDGKDNSETGTCLPSCIDASCGDLFIQDGVETCDGSNVAKETCETQRFQGGSLICAADCMSFDTSNCYICGDGALDPGEDCDGNVYENDVTCASFSGHPVSGGMLACTAMCTMIDSSGCMFCGDGMLEGTEDCDTTQFGGITCANNPAMPMGTPSGMPTCEADCDINFSGCTYCGDGMIQGSEDCEEEDLASQTCVTQGFTIGDLACTPSCSFDESDCSTCNNNILEGDEECDMDQFGTATCLSVMGAGWSGTLTCQPNCIINTSGCCHNMGQSCADGLPCCAGTTCNPGTMTCMPP
jgi:Domain of unknown function (DUF4215)